MKNIQIYSGSFGKKIISTNANTWSELEVEIQTQYSLPALKAVENINRTELSPDFALGNLDPNTILLIAPRVDSTKGI